MNNRLMAPVGCEEIKAAVFSMGSLKAPGPDGLNGMFYQQNWEVVGDLVCQAVQSFFETGSLPSEINDTIVALTPKIPMPECISHLRPISCCNFVYKVISKVMVTRLKPIMGSIISPQQSAFVGGRMIQDNLAIAHEAFHRVKRKRGGLKEAAIIKLDMNKAYDRVEWRFLKESLLSYGFCDEWVLRIMTLVSSVSYKYQVNGFLSNSLTPLRGLRQGDPISPYLFILIFDVLSRLIYKTRAYNVISGVEVAAGLPLTHLFFADDAILFAKASKQELYSIMSCLNLFSRASGQRINLMKSGLVFSYDVPMHFRCELAEVLHIPVWENAGSYLGIPSEWGRSKVKALQWIKDRVTAKMEGWKEKLLNQAGKEVLIKSIIQAIPSYVMSLVYLPKTFCKSLCALVARFWWKAEGKARGIHWKSWKVLSTSKEEGGMGFKNFEDMNISLLAKQAWRLIQNPNTIWASNLLKLYCSKESFWIVKKKNGDSWLWASLLMGRDLLKKQGCWAVGNGAKIDIQCDKWLASGTLATLNDQGQVPKLSECIDNVNKSWNLQIIGQVLHHTSAMDALKTPISLFGSEDEFFWPHTTDGCYSVKSGYYAAVNGASTSYNGPSSSRVIPKEFWNGIWSARVPPKVKTFIWRLCHNALPLRSSLCSKRIAKDPICPICANEVESVEHAFLLCPWVEPLWFSVQVCSVPQPLYVTSCTEWLAEFICPDGSKFDPHQLSMIFLTLWYIWKGRNSFVFEGKVPNPRGTLEMINALATDCVDPNVITKPQTEGSATTNQIRAMWRPPRAGVLKINTDASFIQHTGRVVGGYIMRDENGDLISGNTYKGLASCPLMAEALVLRDAMIFADNLRVNRVVLESDCLILVQACRNEKIVRNIINIINDIETLKSHFEGCAFTWVGREGNQLAHSVANLLRQDALPVQWLRAPPSSLRQILVREKQRISSTIPVIVSEIEDG